jgi:hypothetical protein
MTNIDTAKLLGIARQLSDYGVSLSTRTAAPDPALYTAMGSAFIDIAEAIGDITVALSKS